MRQTMTGAIVVGVLLVAGAALAQSSGPSPEPAWRDVVPVTGPSAVTSVDPARPVPIPAVVHGDGKNGPSARTGSPTAARPAPHAAKAGHKPAAKAATKKATVKKASTPKHVAKAGVPKTRHVAATKQQPAGHHAMVSKPIPLTKSQAPTKGSAPAQPVLPRV